MEQARCRSLSLRFAERPGIPASSAPDTISSLRKLFRGCLQVTAVPVRDGPEPSATPVRCHFRARDVAGQSYAMMRRMAPRKCMDRTRRSETFRENHSPREYRPGRIPQCRELDLHDVQRNRVLRSARADGGFDPVGAAMTRADRRDRLNDWFTSSPGARAELGLSPRSRISSRKSVPPRSSNSP